MKNRINSKLLTFAIGAASVLGTGGYAMAADATDITSQLSSSATTAITALIAVVGTILLAGFSVPVAKKAYGIVKSALSKA